MDRLWQNTSCSFGVAHFLPTLVVLHEAWGGLQQNSGRLQPSLDGWTNFLHNVRPSSADFEQVRTGSGATIGKLSTD